METLSILLALFKGDPVTIGLLTWAVMRSFDVFFDEQALKQYVELSVIWDAMMLLRPTLNEAFPARFRNVIIWRNVH